MMLLARASEQLQAGGIMPDEYTPKKFFRAWVSAAFPRWERGEAFLSHGGTWLLSILSLLGVAGFAIAGVAVNPSLFVAAFLAVCLLMISPYRLWRDANVNADKIET